MLFNGLREIGFPAVDVNGETQLGTMITQTTTINGIRHSTNRAFIRPIRYKRFNLVIKTEAYVTKVFINQQNKVAYGVEYIKDGVSNIAYARKGVIISAGSLNSPKILKLSGIGPKHELDNFNIKVIKDLEVGYNLQDHVTTGAFLIALSNKTSTLINGNELLNNIKKIAKFEIKQGPLSSVGVLDVVAFHRTEFASKEDKTVPDIQYHFSGKNLKEFYSDAATYTATYILPVSYYDSIAVRPILITPKSRGYVLLNKTNPTFGPPLLYSKCFTQKQDIYTLVSAMRFILKLEDTENFKASGAKFVRTLAPGVQIIVGEATNILLAF